MPSKLVAIRKINSATTLLTLNRPEKRNALNISLLEALCDTFEEIQSDAAQRVILLNGEGAVFCAGLDLKEAEDHSLADRSASLIARFLTLVYLSPLISIAAVHGAAIAGGAGLMCACDMAFAAKGTSIGFPETWRGLVPALISVVLSRQLPMRNVRDLLLTGALLSAEEAHKIGLVNKIVEANDLLSAALDRAKLVLKGAPEAVRMTKRHLIELEHGDFLQDIQKALTLHHRARGSPEAREGIAAFMANRAPSWENIS